MNALEARDQLFPDLHAEVLKPRGFKKTARWATKSQGEFVVAVYLRSSRWCRQDWADFWLDLRIFHRGWHELRTGESVLPKPKEQLFGLIGEVLGELDGPEHRALTIKSGTDVPALKATLAHRLREQLFPLEESCQTLEGALSYLESSRSWPFTAATAAGVALLLGDEDRAKAYMVLAKGHATHENRLQWLKALEEALWKNWLKLKE